MVGNCALGEEDRVSAQLLYRHAVTSELPYYPSRVLSV